MFKVELKINNTHLKTYAFANPLTVKQILQEEDLKTYRIIAATIDNKHIKLESEISSDCKIECISTHMSEGIMIYQDTALFILMKAYHNLFLNRGELVIEHSIGDGIFAEIFGGNSFTSDDVSALKLEMQNIISKNLKIEKVTLTAIEATEIFSKLNRDDVIKNLTHRDIVVYRCGDYYDYYLRPLADDTSFIEKFDLYFHAPGVIIRFPKKANFELSDEFVLQKNLFATHQEHDKWLNILEIHNVSALNRAIDDYRINQLILIEEALHEKKIINIANKISWKKDVKLILIAGPSSSGKTTFAKRLAVQLRVNGLKPHIIGMDDYFLSRELTPRKENGDYDFESISAIDLALINEHLHLLLNGKEIELPKYNFITGISENSHHKLKLGDSDVLIMEGIHGLNDELTKAVPFNQKVKIYVSALNNLNIDSHNRIPTTDSRKVRRIIRDFNFRGHSAEQTLKMWDNVREGEDSNIFPFQENADFMFNSILTYELAVLKKHIVPILKEISGYSPFYREAQRLLKMLYHIGIIQDEAVPSNSIIREFISGSSFKY